MVWKYTVYLRWDSCPSDWFSLESHLLDGLNLVTFWLNFVWQFFAKIPNYYLFGTEKYILAFYIIIKSYLEHFEIGYPR